MLSSLGWSQCDGCNSNTTEYWNNSSEEDFQCIDWVESLNSCNTDAINFLQLLMNSTNDSDLLEFGNQLWRNNRLIYLKCRGCGITGNLPQEINLVDSLEHLNLQVNFISYIPDEISDLERLMYINLRDNELTGVIPEFIYSIPTLKELRLNNNNFEGIRILCNNAHCCNCCDSKGNHT